jgi:hypothetical protein
MPGIIDVSSIQEDESEMNQQDGFKLLLELSELVEKPTDELHVDLADDMIHATEDLSECGGSDSETEGESIIITFGTKIMRVTPILRSWISSLRPSTYREILIHMF